METCVGANEEVTLPQRCGRCIGTLLNCCYSDSRHHCPTTTILTIIRVRPGSDSQHRIQKPSVTCLSLDSSEAFTTLYSCGPKEEIV
ncbi:hypothetical protein Pcinc_007455 [Petrolisthes cinctipes]|uniref:Uncharacterized protein n=1 Tax=Petrolisthes cinctipes TaxID=88211 RepID=A0AAE1GB05_PETCI|nr:hypothetical protein Pcinc_007455 [Petrolisthes cinctipes]